MANAMWKWPHETKIRELYIDFTIYNDIDLAGGNGIYLMLCYGHISDVAFTSDFKLTLETPTKTKNEGKD